MLAFTHSIIIYLLLMISLTVVIFRWNILWYFIWLPIKIPSNLYILYCILRPCYPALLWHHKLIQWHNDYLNWRLVFLLNLKIIFLTTSLYHIASIFAILNNNNNMYYFIREGSSLCTIIFTQNKKGTRRETCFHRMKDVLPLFIRLSKGCLISCVTILESDMCCIFWLCIMLHLTAPVLCDCMWKKVMSE